LKVLHDSTRVDAALDAPKRDRQRRRVKIEGCVAFLVSPPTKSKTQLKAAPELNE